MNRKVELEFTVTKPNGEAVKGFDDISRFEYVEGDGNMLPIIESAVRQAQAGERLRVRVEPRQGFGDYLNSRRETFVKDKLPLDSDIKEGDLYLMPTEGFSNMAKVLSTDEQSVTLDANHPLAGVPVIFHITVTKAETIN